MSTEVKCSDNIICSQRSDVHRRGNRRGHHVRRIRPGPVFSENAFTGSNEPLIMVLHVTDYVPDGHADGQR